jgi:hypothetical protein
MLEHDTRLSLAELSAAGIRLRPVDAVTIVREVIAQVIRGEIQGVPSAHVIRLTPAGTLTIEGPVAAGGRPVSRAAQLLDTLLPGFDAPPEFRVPGALRLIVARALGTLDVEPHSTLESLSEALERFGAADSTAALRELVDSYGRAHDAKPQPVPGGPELQRPNEHVTRVFAAGEANSEALVRAEMAEMTGLSISDIRRARRATGLSLTEISSRTRIPVGLLRQLEWGYLRNWPSGASGRTQLVRYARAAGLDEQTVISVAAPLVEEAGLATSPLVYPDQIEVVLGADSLPGPRELGDELALAVRPRPRRARRVLLAALAVPALLAIGFVPGAWDEVQRRLPQRLAPLPEAPPPAVARDVVETPAPAAAADPVPAVASNPEPRPTTATHEPATAPPAPTAARVDAADYSDAFASAGGASFQDPAEGSATGQVVPTASSSGSGAVLRITRIVNDTSHNFHVRLSPDGSRIAFDSDRDGLRGVYLADADGTNVRRVSGEGFAAVPSWSPDSRTLAYVKAESDQPRVWNLWALDLESATERRLTSNPSGQPWGGSWFPDGRRIVYSLADRLVVLDTGSGRARSYPAPNTSAIVRTPAVSPDGRRIMFQVDRDGAWLLELPDGAVRKVLSDPTAEDYTWSPDGRRVAYYSRQSGEWGVWVLARQ